MNLLNLHLFDMIILVKIQLLRIQCSQLMSTTFFVKIQLLRPCLNAVISRDEILLDPDIELGPKKNTASIAHSKVLSFNEMI